MREKIVLTGSARRVPRRLRSAFSLVELLVVIGIIAILSGVLLTVTGTGSESARAAKCLANLRSLAQAANSTAMQNGVYPYAGSYQKVGVGGSGIVYNEHVGWISWLSNKGDPFGHETGNSKPSSPVKVDLSTYDDKNDEDRLYALTNGAIWKATHQNVEIYRCPTHLRTASSNNEVMPNFSYVMNAKFGYDYSRGSKGVYKYIEYGELGRADRVLMFAELDTENGSDKYAKDCTLQYKATVNGNSYGKEWGGKGEKIAFPHKTNKGRKCAHVAFADGHTEKLLKPEGNGGLALEALTALLCEGKDVTYDGSNYQEIKETD